ncbi:TraM recognition domain-containing protein [Hamadaea sp. NPDC051192]|uniref:type IV secretory system conjugative DNA transfer family protein n=1 Tax=Hamadaea sp. NPDC051192 TaxID=3154940 RepID=UPI003428A035
MTSTAEQTTRPAIDPAIDISGLQPFAVRPTRRLFLGFDDATGQRRWTNQLRDSLAIVGPPGYGKTSGVLIPNLLSWDGPMVSTSTRGDLLQATGDQRRRLAEPHGQVYIYDPFGTEPGVRSMGWSPHAGCKDASVAYRRAAAMTTTSTHGLAGAGHWRTGASRILRGVFHAAALADQPLSVVRSWLTLMELDQPVEILRTHPDAARGWSDDLNGINRVADRERSSFYSAAINAIDATVEPVVLDSTELAGLDVDLFLATKSSLFVVGPRHLQEQVAPLIVGIIESISDRASEIAAANGGVLTDPLLLALDEVANIAPIPSLPEQVSEGGGRGKVTIWTAQSLAAMRERYGEHQAQAILTATTAKLIQGGMSSGTDLRNVSDWAGELREPSATFYQSGVDMQRGRSNGFAAGHDTDRQHSITRQYRPVLPIQEIQQLSPFHAWMFYRSDQPVLVRTPPAALVDAFAAVSGWTPDEVAAAAGSPV